MDARVEEIELHDIAHALSNVCRFGGHCKHFYSVAQHSMVVSHIVPAELALAGLMHDATEAYIGDMVRPIKYSMPVFRAVEDKLWRLIAEKFGLPPILPPEVKHADDVALITERRDVMCDQTNHVWSLVQEGVKPCVARIVPLGPSVARLEFLRRFYELQRKTEALKPNTPAPQHSNTPPPAQP
ncbi:MAG: hypothetical protein HZA88_00470 [Verrucomicrobia bacterium]|nr:hypothetical protein [Verrucomicrobiota bacterium]